MKNKLFLLCILSIGLLKAHGTNAGTNKQQIIKKAVSAHSESKLSHAKTIMPTIKKVGRAGFKVGGVALKGVYKTGVGAAKLATKTALIVPTYIMKNLVLPTAAVAGGVVGALAYYSPSYRAMVMRSAKYVNRWRQQYQEQLIQLAKKNIEQLVKKTNAYKVPVAGAVLALGAVGFGIKKLYNFVHEPDEHPEKTAPKPSLKVLHRKPLHNSR